MQYDVVIWYAQNSQCLKQWVIDSSTDSLNEALTLAAEHRRRGQHACVVDDSWWNRFGLSVTDYNAVAASLDKGC